MIGSDLIVRSKVWSAKIVTRAKIPGAAPAKRIEVADKKANGRERGSVRAHSYSWSLSSPQQPLETEDSPTVSLAPKYTSQRSCRARGNLLSLPRLYFFEVLTKT